MIAAWVSAKAGELKAKLLRTVSESHTPLKDMVHPTWTADTKAEFLIKLDQKAVVQISELSNAMKKALQCWKTCGAAAGLDLDGKEEVDLVDEASAARDAAQSFVSCYTMAKLLSAGQWSEVSPQSAKKGGKHHELWSALNDAYKFATSAAGIAIPDALTVEVTNMIGKGTQPGKSK